MFEKTANFYRSGAGAIALVAGVTLLARLYLRLQNSDGILDAVSFMSQYFTILTNFLVLVVTSMIAMKKHPPPAFVRAVVVSIACVGLLYHSLLAHLVNLSGLDLWADHGTHTVVPILSVVWWVISAENPQLSSRDLVYWVAWPLTYTVYILARASFSGFYPYPFLNLPEIGANRLMINVVVISLGFTVVGCILAGTASLIRKGLTK